jgi:DNA-binding MarR family transcriptional regulator
VRAAVSGARGTAEHTWDDRPAPPTDRPGDEEAPVSQQPDPSTSGASDRAGVARRAVDQTLVEEFLTASRALMGLAVHSLGSAPVDVTPPQHRVLVLLAGRGPQSVTEVAEELGVNRSNATRICDRLERAGLVRRSPSSEDGRVVQVDLTPAGLELVDAVTQSRRAEIERVLRGMSAAERRAAVRALEAFNRSAGELDDSAWVRRTV